MYEWIDGEDGVVLTLSGASIVAVGLWLPWLVVEAGYDGPVPAIYIYGMETGIATADRLLLAVLTITLVSAVRYRTRRLSGLLVLGSGGLVVLFALAWLLGTTGLDGRRLGVFVVGRGFHLTIVGGVLLAGAGWIRFSARRNRTGT